jgi:hypothetical protein
MMSGFTVEIKHDRLDVRLGKVEPGVLKALRGTIETLDAELVNAAKALAPVRSGKYRESIKGSVRSSRNSVVGKVYSNSPLAHIEESGAHIPAHDILPKIEHALHFGGSAGDVFAARVHSPGAVLPAKHVIEGAFENMQGQIRSEIEQAARAALREI